MSGSSFWLSDEAWAAIEPHLPKNQPGARRVDDRRVISGIIHMLKCGGRWQDVPAVYGPATTVYNRWNRWSRRGVFRRLLAALSGTDVSTLEAPEEVVTDRTELRTDTPSTRTRSIGNASLPFSGTSAPARAEDSLGLSMSERREIQGRLNVLGHDTRGIDGIFGPGTRAVIAAWQASRGFVVTGYFDGAQIAALRKEAAAQNEARQKKQTAEPTSRSGGSSPVGRYIDSHGCMRERDGRAVPGYKASCK